MSNLENRVTKLEAATASHDHIPQLTDAELDRMIDSVPDYDLRLLTDAELEGLEEVYTKAAASGQDERLFMTPELTAALERVKR
jgi:hypothetical protein